MARTKVNKSQAIREALAAHKDKSPQEIANILTAKGVKVSATFVSTIKSKSKSKKAKGKRGRRPNIEISKGVYADVETTIIFAERVGGLTKAKQLIALLEKVRDI